MSLGNKKIKKNSGRNDLKKHGQENQSECVGMGRINTGFQKNFRTRLGLLLDKNSIRKRIFWSAFFAIVFF